MPRSGPKSPRGPLPSDQKGCSNQEAHGEAQKGYTVIFSSCWWFHLRSTGDFWMPILQDKDSKFRLILVESRIHRLARYYKTKRVLPPNWK